MKSKILNENAIIIIWGSVPISWKDLERISFCIKKVF